MKINLIFFAIGLIIGLYLSSICGGDSQSADRLPPTTVSVKQLGIEAAKSESYFAGKLKSLQAENKNLGIDLDSTKTALRKVKEKSKGLEQRIKALAQTALKDQGSPLAYNASCDSLIGTVELLMHASVGKDSLYEKVVTGLEAQVENRDSTIAIGIARYGLLKASLEKSLQCQALLAKQNDWMGKTVKRQKVKSKVLTALILTGGGIVAGYLIRH